MRQRKVKNEAELLAAYSQYTIEDPAACKGRWQEFFGGEDKPLCIEVGCGKGKFITTLADQNRDKNYLAFEGHRSVVIRALEKIEKLGLTNVFIYTNYVNEITDFFADGEVDQIYLNFSDPWPKARHAKRRLTHSRFLTSYRQILKADGILEFKTDNDALFAFAVEEFRANGLEFRQLSDDLHNSDLPARLVTTEYEDRFKRFGKNIHYCQAVFGAAPEGRQDATDREVGKGKDAMKKALIVVDYQKDFVSGALGFEGAEKLEAHITARLDEYLEAGQDVIFTLDTHEADYLNTQEGKKLPVPHCVKGSEGWTLYGKLHDYSDEAKAVIEKPSFGSLELAELLRQEQYEVVELLGLVSNICVISNAVIAKAALPEAEIIVDAKGTDSFDKALHEKCLEVLEGLQITVKR